jgi:asparagine synthase (glutamine-hydrolysing)
VHYILFFSSSRPVTGRVRLEDFGFFQKAKRVIEPERSTGAQVLGACENGILPWSWKGWEQACSMGGVSLFVEGFAASDDELHTTNGGEPESWGAPIIDLYKARGARFLNHLRGSFAIVLWDAPQKTLIIGTDHFGTRSIYVWASDNRIAFATRIAQFAMCAEIPKLIEPNSIYFYLNHSFIPAPFTIYKNIRRLEPGHFLQWTNGRVTFQRYWDMAYDEDSSLSEAAAAASLRSSVQDSVRFALRAGVRDEQMGAFLSGGTDSSVLVGLLSQISEQKTKSFSVGFDEAAYNEICYARIAARHFNSDAHEYFVRADEALDAMPTLASAYDEPFGNSSAIPTYFCLKMARDAGIKIMFAGDGGDELFGGNERYITEKVFTLYHEIPSTARTLIDHGAKIIPASYPWRKIKNYVHKANLPACERFFTYQLYFRDHADAYLTDEFRASIDREFALDVPRQHYLRAGNIAPLNRLLYVDLKLAMADNDLFKVNRTAAIHGIQVHYPYLDPLVGRISGKIPARLKVKGWTKRYIFKKAFENLLPKAILQKKKHGFGLPTGEWLRYNPGFRDLARSLLLDSRAIQRGYLKRPAIEQLLKLHDGEASSYFATHIWNLMMLELWHRHHADITSSRASRKIS